jgi:serine phosphatase RsbU (regulator of sigma subunit)
VWIKALLAAGGLLAVALLTQTALNYRFVSTNLIRQEARRTAENTVRSVDRATRLSRPQDAEALRAILDEIRNDSAEQIGSIAVVGADGAIVAAVGQTTSAFAPVGPERLVQQRDSPLRSERRDNRDVLIGVFPCRCNVPASSPGGGQPRPSRLFVEIAVYPDALSASFARLRRNAAISAAAALALLVSVSLIAVRLGPHVRGKQLEAQMDAARQVQLDLLPPAETPPLESSGSGANIAAHCVPAWQVGGDFYDIVRLQGDGIAFVIGDVSGHGISAALLMGLIHGAMSAPPWGEAGNEPDLAAARLNQLLLAKSSGERYASLFWCAYDPTSGVVRYLNAGHPPPIWIRRTAEASWTIDRFSQGGPVLGVLASATYDVSPVQARDGDLLVLFSDGIVEAVNRRDEPFGEDRLIAIVRERARESVRTICDAILDGVRVFSEGRPAQDDQTLLVVRLWRANALDTNQPPVRTGE